MSTIPNIIVARWEWRSFSQHADDFATVFAKYEPIASQSSQEVYFVSPNPKINIKYRYDTFDVKQLLEINSDGYEKWQPIFKSSLPLQGPDLDLLLEIAGIDISSDLTLVTLADVQVQLGLPSFKLQKDRQKFKVNGVSCEYTEISYQRKKVVTIAIEDQDPLKINNARSALGTLAHANMNYPAALRAFFNRIR